MNEQSILNIIYTMYEGDTSNWDVSSDEYLSARIYANAAINRWEFYDQTNWHELWTSLDDVTGVGAKTILASTYSYVCPKNMIKPASYVRTNDDYWDVVQLAKVPSLVDTTGNWCYFTGSVRGGFTLHFNPDATMTAGQTIHYEYYKAATKFTSTDSETEMSDPYFIVFFVLSRFYENDGEISKATKAFQESEARLEQMRTQNMLQVEGVQDNIETTLDNNTGFGY